MEKAPPLIELIDVHRTYMVGQGVVHALHGTDLRIQAGELIVLLGPNGSGKSTLLNVLGGIDEPTRGRVLYAGEPLTGEDRLETHRRRRIGFVFQFYNLIPNLTARENVEISTMLCTDPLDPDAALDQVGLAERADHFPSQLSGGEQQRVSIARALAKRPEILLCDEPTGALDLDTGRTILSLLHRIHREASMTVLIVTHNQALARMSERVIRLAGGRILEDRVQTPEVLPEEVAW